jgi:hypothetical protein
MGELLPEFWAGLKEDERDGKTRRSRKVTDVFTWLHCFATYVAVRAAQRPEMIPELKAYMSTIVWTSQDFEGLVGSI